MTRRPLLAALPLALTLVAGAAAAQTRAAPPLPWDAPSAQAGAQLLAAGFQRRPQPAHQYAQVPGGRFQPVAADTATSTYTRRSGGVTESVFVRTGPGMPRQIFYSAIGDSASLQAKLDAVAADAAARAGTAAPERGMRVWRPGGTGRLAVPAGPSPLPNGDFQFMVLFTRP